MRLGFRKGPETTADRLQLELHPAPLHFSDDEPLRWDASRSAQSNQTAKVEHRTGLMGTVKQAIEVKSYLKTSPWGFD